MIHLCDKSCGNKTAIGYCATTVCINPLYSNIGTAQYGQGVQKRIITNADKIRSILCIPEEEEILAVIAIGKRAEDPTLRPRKPLEDIVKIF